VRAALPLLLVLLLAGCSQLQPTEPLTPSEPSLLLQLERWSLEGRIGIRHAGESNSASLSWQQRPTGYRIALTGPLGQGGLQIEGNTNAVTLQQAGSDEVHRAATPEALMQRLLGWSLPLSQARYWVLGLPDPALEWQPLAFGEGFSQQGWQIEYPRYTRAGPLVLPEKIRLTRPDLRITVVVSHWETTPPR
jgi:outer membrane lipoprotein LolB